ncbi:calcium channel flower-like [Hydractinia symbiolongicarpus]|uniref:calcium channel flower-like n=1 Tax=Hydractinia symbiolongicarpus TaxID=13093 RepID=UPI0025516B08|nr:calcium channel flower-like [Hydractinia symbiolongicarpus]
MAKSQEGEKKSEEAPRIFRFLIRVWGAVAALCSVSTGLFVLITITSSCLIAGIVQICVGLIILPLETPFLCSKFDILIKISDWVEKYFKFWLRATFYLVGGIPPFLLCNELSTFIGSGAILVLAALYGVLAIGRKGGGVKAASPAKSDDVEMKTKLMTDSGEPNNLNTY